MGFSIMVRLRQGRFDAATQQPGRGEWPPHPARVFCALAASATQEVDWGALPWLETAGSPYVYPCPTADTAQTRRAGYVVTNATTAKGGSQSWPGRTSGQRHRVSVLPTVDEVAIVWPRADPDDATLARLVRPARRVPYLGRATSPVEVTAVPDAALPRHGWVYFQPTTLGSVDSVELRVPYLGYVQRLRDAYDDGRRAWEMARSVAYAPEPTGKDQPSTDTGDAVAGPYRDLLVFGFDGPMVPDAGVDLLQVTQTLPGANGSRKAIGRSRGCRSWCRHE